MCGTTRKRRKMDAKISNFRHSDEMPMDEDTPKVSPKESPMDQVNFLAMQLRETKIAPKGLPNLGNTCFYNSTSQCLLNTHHLQFYSQLAGKGFNVVVPDCSVIVYEKKIHLKASEIIVEFEKNTPFIHAFKQYINEFYSNRSINPRPVFSEVAQRAPRFRGWHQQDSHELLRYLIDGLRQEELDAIDRSVKHHLKDENLKKEDAHLTKRAYMNFAKPFLDRVFGGALLQIVRCSECEHDSVCFEPFLDLSLSIPKNVVGVTPKQQSVKMSKSQQKKLNKKKKKKKGKKERGRKQSSTEYKKNEVDEQSNVGNEENQVPDGEEQEENSASYNGTTKSNENDTDVDAEYEETGNVSDAAPDPERENSIAKLEFSHPLSDAKVQEDKNIQFALKRFTELEDLRGSNAYECESCCAPENKKMGKRHKTVSAQKKYMLYTLPPVLTLHLKRFEKTQQHGRIYTNKVSDHVDFPLILDVAPYCSKLTEAVSKGQTKILYSLYGVVCHSGSLSGGHYVAYVKSRKPIEHIEKFFREASRFDASSIGDFKQYEQLESDAAAKSRPNDNMTEEKARAALDSSGVWYYCSDSSVQLTSQERALSAEAYLLFYERFY